MDDGQVFIKPKSLNLYLQSLDAEALKVGASRGRGSSVKSVARIVGTQEAVRSVATGLGTAYVRATCKVCLPNSPTEVLGAIVGGGRAEAEAHFASASCKAKLPRHSRLSDCPKTQRANLS